MKLINLENNRTLRATFVIIVLLQCLVWKSTSSRLEDGTNNHNKHQNNDIQGTSGGVAQITNKRSSSFMNDINRKQISTNMVASGLEVKPYSRKQLIKLVRYMAKQGGLRRGYRTKRTVESPARSTDTGGRPSQSGLAGGINRLFGSKQGHYSDAYDQIDYERDLNSTQKTTEPSETLMRIDIQDFDEKGETSKNKPTSNRRIQV